MTIGIRTVGLTIICITALASCNKTDAKNQSTVKSSQSADRGTAIAATIDLLSYAVDASTLEVKYQKYFDPKSGTSATALFEMLQEQEIKVALLSPYCFTGLSVGALSYKAEDFQNLTGMTVIMILPSSDGDPKSQLSINLNFEDGTFGKEEIAALFAKGRSQEVKFPGYDVKIARTISVADIKTILAGKVLGGTETAGLGNDGAIVVDSIHVKVAKSKAR